MWDWAHFKEEGWLAHLKRSAKLSGLLILSGLAMIGHMLLPFWQQPDWLSISGVRDALDEALKRQKLQKIVRLIHSLTILILFDLVATLLWVQTGLATEANPVMNYFLQCSPGMFVFAKLGLSIVGIYILYFFRTKFQKMIFNILLGLNIIYLLVFAYHLSGALFLLFSTI